MAMNITMSLKAALDAATRVAKLTEHDGLTHQVRRISWLGSALVSMSVEDGRTFHFNPLQEILLQGDSIFLFDVHGHVFAMVLEMACPVGVQDAGTDASAYAYLAGYRSHESAQTHIGTLDHV